MNEWQVAPDDQHAIRERILLYAQAGVGKTYALLSLATLYMDSNFYILDTDDRFERIWKERFSFLPNIRYKRVNGWEQIEDRVKFLKEMATKGQLQKHDWVCIEMLGRWWEMAQFYEVQRVYGADKAQVALEDRATSKRNKKEPKPGGLETFDWNIVKELHNPTIGAVLQLPCNIVATTSADEIISFFDRKDSERMNLFGQIGYKPEGEKHNFHLFDTVLFLELVLATKQRFMTSLKDTGRPLLNRVEFGDNLYLDYIEAVKAEA
uniref:Putative ATPase domain containing protein n=1 Tax=viral metagenome TaxID=1070528 RepID=A0A6M3LER3_9ZZZZ